MRLRAAVAAAAVSILGLLGTGLVGAAPALAADYPPSVNCTVLLLSASVVAPGVTIQISLQGAVCFAPGSLVSIDLHTAPVHLADVTADSGGGISGSVTIPADTPLGSHTVTATGVDPSGATVVATAPLAVVNATTTSNNQSAPTSGGTTTSSSGLAFTGANLAVTAGTGGLLVAGGIGAIVATRRRHSTKRT